MTLLDRHIARHFAINALALLVILCTFIVSVDATLNIDRFVNAADGLAGERGGEPSAFTRILLTGYLVVDLWWPRLLQLLPYLLGFVMVGAMGFTCAQMVRHREFVAILASGQSLRRVARPIVVVGAIMVLAQVINQEVVVPRIAPLLTRDHGDSGRRVADADAIPLTSDGFGRLFLASSFRAREGVIEDLYVWERDGNDLVTGRIHADRAVWSAGGWDLEGGYAQAPSGEIEAPEPEPVARIETDLDPRTITTIQYAAYSQSLGFAQIGRMLEGLRASRGDSDQIARRIERLERLRWGRFSIALANLLGLLIALPYFLTRVPRNMLYVSIRCAPVSLGSIMGAIIGSAAPIPGLPAGVAVFLPVLVLIPMVIGLMLRVRS